MYEGRMLRDGLLVNLRLALSLLREPSGTFGLPATTHSLLRSNQLCDVYVKGHLFERVLWDVDDLQAVVDSVSVVVRFLSRVRPKRHRIHHVLAGVDAIRQVLREGVRVQLGF